VLDNIPPDSKPDKYITAGWLDLLEIHIKALV
jgi:hypothetical protein